MVAHFYHLWVGDSAGRWRGIAQAHFVALRQSRFSGDVYLGLVGPAELREEAKHLFPEATVVVDADEGWEVLTIAVMREYARQLPVATPVLFAHAKGTLTDTEINRTWCAQVTADLVRSWSVRIPELEFFDVVVLYGCGEGGFYWARAEYLADLPDPLQFSREEAEAWIASGGASFGRLSSRPPGVGGAYDWNPTAGRNFFQ